MNSDEKREYGDLLKCEYFKKSNFGELEHFYSKSYDKLTASGTDQMSQRVWAGIQHGEYTFGELPQVVQEKESKRLYEKVKEGHDARIESIPAAAREEFSRAYETGNRQKISEVLSKAEFARSLGSGSSDSPRESEHGQQSTAEEHLERPKVRGQSAAAIAAISGETVADPVSTAPLSPVELSKALGVSAPSR